MTHFPSDPSFRAAQEREVVLQRIIHTRREINGGTTIGEGLQAQLRHKVLVIVSFRLELCVCGEQSDECCESRRPVVPCSEGCNQRMSRF